MFFKVREKLPKGIIGVSNLAVVGVAEQSSNSRRRIVRRVRIVEMDPHKKGLGRVRRLGGHPAKRVTDHLLRGALQVLKVESDWIVPPHFSLEGSRIGVEAPAQPALGVEDIGAYKSSRDVAVPFEEDCQSRGESLRVCSPGCRGPDGA